MQLPLSGLWQISPLTDLSVPQNDVIFPAALSQALPEHLSEEAIAEQEWHLMHDFELDESALGFACINLVLEGIYHYAEVRVNGLAVMDCDSDSGRYVKNIRPYVQQGGNRIEVLFLTQEEDWLLESPPSCPLTLPTAGASEQRVGIWQQPYLQFVRHVKLTHITTEQIWHPVGGCEFKVDLFFETFSPGLISASVRFDGRTYQLPVDMRTNQVSALFQLDAPNTSAGAMYLLEVALDGQQLVLPIKLTPELCAQHFSLE